MPMPPMPFADPPPEPLAAWLLFAAVLVWTGMALLGLVTVRRLALEWGGAYRRVMTRSIDEERRIRARGLRRRALYYVVILGVYLVAGLVRLVSEPTQLTSLLITGSLVLSAWLIVCDVRKEARDIERIARISPGQGRRATDAPPEGTPC